MNKRRFVIGSVGIILFVIMGSAIFCAKRTERSADKVSVRLDWLPQAQFAGVYVAQEKGYFKEKNLDVTINPGGVDFNPIQLVASGSDLLGMANADQLIVARAKGLPLVGIAAIFQQNPSVFMAKQSSGISTPHDFVGKRVGVKYGTSPDILYRAMMNKLGINIEKVKEVPVQFDLASFFADQVDVWPGYAINEALVAKEKGFEINIINPFDYGIYDYADVIFTTDKVIKEKPDLVKKFLEAVLKGWQYAVDNPEEAVDILLKNTQGLNKTHERAMMQAVIPLVTTGVRNKIGQMDPAKWEATYRFMLEQKQIGKPFNIIDVYTLRFLAGIYK